MTAHQQTWNGRLATVSEAPIISVNEARKVLGKQAKSVSDDDLMLVVYHMRKIAESMLTNVIGSKKQQGML
jgi:hypothetical protein